MGKNGREYVVRYHSYEAIAKGVATVCESTAPLSSNTLRPTVLWKDLIAPLRNRS